MTVLNVRTARAIWLVDSRDLNPRGIEISPVIEGIKNRYNFTTYPTKVEEVDETNSKGIVFMNGSFATGNTRHAIVKATVHGDGIVVDSNLSTDFCEAFLADALTFLSTQFGFTYSPEMIQTKIFTSELIVRSDRDLNRFFVPLATIQEKLDILTGHSFEPFGIRFNIDSTATTARPAQFVFEREVGKRFSQNRYYSSAPLRTKQHEELLLELESLL